MPDLAKSKSTRVNAPLDEAAPFPPPPDDLSLRKARRWSGRRRILVLLIVLAIGWTTFEVVWRLTAVSAPVVDYFAKLNELVASHQGETEENGWETMMEVLVLFAEIESDAMNVEIDVEETLFYIDFWQLRTNPHLPDRFPREMFITQQLEERGVNAALQRVADSPRIGRSYAGGSSIMSMMSPELSRYQYLSRVIGAQMRLESEADDFDSLVARYEQCLAIARASASQATIIERLVGDAIVALAYGELSNILMERHLDEPTCRALLAAMDRQLNWPSPAITLEAERLSILDNIQTCFTDDGHGDGRLNFDKFSVMTGMTGGGLPAGGGALGAISSNFLAGRQETTDKANELMDELIRVSRLSFAQRREEVARLETSIESLPFRHTFLRLLLPAITRSLDQHDFVLMLQRGARLMLGLEIFYARHGRYPDSLDELVPDILPEILIDPLTDEPFIYRLLEGEVNGLQYILYSAGRNGIDDHAGVEITDVNDVFISHGYGSDGDIHINTLREDRVEYDNVP